ncbi:MAG: non-homologous end-joining DNA ligase [Planctomycetaceae bacterium]
MPAAGKRTVKPEGVEGVLSHPERVVFEEDGITKLDVAKYYFQVADWFIPHAAGRPLSMVRCPEGIGGKCFFQKNRPRGLPDSVETMTIPMKSKTMSAAIIEDLEGLLALVQFNVIEFHAWQSRRDRIERPDRIILDLDPDSSVPWSEVVETAHLLRDLLDSVGLQCFVKTSGGKGLHVVVPITRRYEWPAVKEFSKALATTMASVHPDRYTATMSKSARKGKIFIDYLRNDRGSTTVLPYSLRTRKTAPVSMPVDWSELNGLNGGGAFTLRNTPQLLAKRKRDPWEEIGALRQTISARVKRLFRLS